MTMAFPIRLPHIGARSGTPTTYFPPATIEPSSAVLTAVANILYFAPFLLPGCTFDRMGVEITTGAAGLARLGLWLADKSTGNPMSNGLILDTGTIDTTNIAVVEASFTALTLPEDVAVWGGIVFNATPAVRTGIAHNNYLCGFGDGSMTQIRKGLQANFTFGALPATAPAITGIATNIPMMLLRKN